MMMHVGSWSWVSDTFALKKLLIFQWWFCYPSLRKCCCFFFNLEARAFFRFATLFWGLSTCAQLYMLNDVSINHWYLVPARRSIGMFKSNAPNARNGWKRNVWNEQRSKRTTKEKTRKLDDKGSLTWRPRPLGLHRGFSMGWSSTLKQPTGFAQRACREPRESMGGGLSHGVTPVLWGRCADRSSSFIAATDRATRPMEHIDTLGRGRIKHPQKFHSQICAFYLFS